MGRNCSILTQSHWVLRRKTTTIILLACNESRLSDVYASRPVYESRFWMLFSSLLWPVNNSQLCLFTQLCPGIPLRYNAQPYLTADCIWCNTTMTLAIYQALQISVYTWGIYMLEHMYLRCNLARQVLECLQISMCNTNCIVTMKSEMVLSRPLCWLWLYKSFASWWYQLQSWCNNIVLEPEPCRICITMSYVQQLCSLQSCSPVVVSHATIAAPSAAVQVRLHMMSCKVWCFYTDCYRTL